jgi:hypothetical protein
MARGPSRKLELETGSYYWKVSHVHVDDPSERTGRRCVETFTAYRAPHRAATLILRFPHGPETGWGFPGASGVICDYRPPTWTINLNTPSAARWLIERFRARGWAPERDPREVFLEADAYDALRSQPDIVETYGQTFPSGREKYDRSFARFIELTGGSGRPRPAPVALPRHDEEDPGPSLFRTRLEELALVRLTLPGLFIGRSSLEAVDLSKSDLSRSTLCWNDFTRCWLVQCDLSRSDLRASTWLDCDFSRSSLRGCDLRHATFERCRFTGADLACAQIPARLRSALALTRSQAASVTWVDDEGPEPRGG